ncbi:MAG TPA: hypothetical protein VM782_14760, partial [Stellaceae bacterium]|nr:hypothetical protein [Stellaceae bacterium]
MLVIAVAGCNDPLGSNRQVSLDAAATLAAAGATPTLLPSAPPPGHAVATMSANRLGANSVPPIVVHGNESQASSDAAKPIPVGSNDPADVTLNFAGADIRDVV